MSGSRFIYILFLILLIFVGGGYVVQKWSGIKNYVPEEISAYAEDMPDKVVALAEKISRGARTLIYGSDRDGQVGKVVTSPVGPAPGSAHVTSSKSASAPRFGTMRLARESGSIFSGTAKPGWRVTVESNGRSIGRSKANRSGNWMLIVQEPLRDQNYKFGVIAHAQGNSRQIERGRDVVVKFMPEDGGTKIIAFSNSGIGSVTLKKPAVKVPPKLENGNRVASSGDTDNQSGVPESMTENLRKRASELADAASEKFTSVLDDLKSETPDKPKIVTASKTKTPVARKSVAALSFDKVVMSNEGGRSGRLELSGRSEPGAKISIYLGQRSIASVTADASGRWSFSGLRNMPFGTNRLQAIHTGRKGKVLARAEYSLRHVASKTIVALKKPSPLLEPSKGVSAHTTGKPATRRTNPQPSSGLKAAQAGAAGARSGTLPLPQYKPRYKSVKKRRKRIRLAQVRRYKKRYRGSMKLGASSKVRKKVRTYHRRRHHSRKVRHNRRWGRSAVRCKWGYSRHRVRRGESLWKIAKRYYGNGRRYHRIYNANRGRVSNPNRIYPSQLICIKRY